jgi:ferric-dicitrate binding protein FerR (iron transport regulator)
MDVTVTAGGDVRQGADAPGEGRKEARSVLGDVASKAALLSGQAAEKAQDIAGNRRKVRRKYRRAAKKQTRKLERRLEKAARRLQIDTPIDKRRRRRTRRRTGLLFVVVVGGGAAVYLAWRARQDQSQGAAEAGPVPDAFGAGVDRAGDGERAPSETAPR